MMYNSGFSFFCARWFYIYTRARARVELLHGSRMATSYALAKKVQKVQISWKLG